MQKVLILCFNYEPSQFLKKPDGTPKFYTYGFGSMFGRLFNNDLKEYQFEVWRLDSYCEEKYYEHEIDGLKFRVFKSIRVPKIGHFSLRFLKALKKEYKATNPLLFVVHTHNWQTYQVAFFLKKAMIVTTHHGEWSPFYLAKNTGGLRKIKAWIEIAAEKLVLKNVNHFLIGDIKQIEYIKKAAPNFDYTLFSSGIDVNALKPIGKTDARSLLGWQQDKNYILYVGKLYKYKQIDELLKIWLEIKKEIPNTEIVLIGNEPPGSWGEEYYDTAVKSGATIVGRVLHTELYKYYCASDVYVLMALRSDYFGGTGIAPIESLACNTPVVSYSMKNYLGEHPEEICEMPDSIEGYKESIMKVLRNKDQFKNMRESVEKYYSYSAIVARVGRVFKNVLQSKK